MLEIFLTVIVIVAVVLIWVSLYDTHHFTITKKQFSSALIRQGKRFVVLSDMHGQQYGRNNEVLFQAIQEQRPDGILIVGDMLTAHKKTKIEPIADFLGRLGKLCPVYYANGNHEHKIGLYPEQFGDLAERYETALAESGIKPIVNSHISLQESGIVVHGVQIDREYYSRLEIPEMPAGYLEQLLGKPSEGMYNILLAHNPDYFPAYAAWGADLVLSGHVHGGIMRLPFLGGVIAPSLKLFPKYDSGVYREQESVMLLGRGIGTHSPNVRFFNPGELIVLDLCPEEEKI